MILFKNINGETYNEQELIGYAKEDGMTLEQYMQDKTFEMIEVDESDETVTTTTETDVMDLGSDDGSLGLLEDKRQ